MVRECNFEAPLDGDSSEPHGADGDLMSESSDEISVPDSSSDESIDVDLVMRGFKALITNSAKRKRAAKKYSFFQKDKVQPKRCKTSNDVGTSKATSRSSVRYFGSVVESLTTRQQEVIESFGFGSLLLYDRCAVPMSFVKWIADQVDPGSSDIVVTNKLIPICPESVEMVLGIPIGGNEIPHESDEGKLFFLHLFDKATFPPIRYFSNLLVNDRDKDELSAEQIFRYFMVVALATFLCPNSNTVPSPSYLTPLIKPDTAKDWNWSKFVCDWTMNYIIKFKKDRKQKIQTSKTLGGCGYYLAVQYLDFKDFGPRNMACTIPRISVWKQRLIKEYSKYDQISGSKYGKRPVLDFAQTCYPIESARRKSASSSNHLNSPSLRDILDGYVGDNLSCKIKDDVVDMLKKHGTTELNVVCPRTVDTVCHVLKYFCDLSNRPSSSNRDNNAFSAHDANPQGFSCSNHSQNGNGNYSDFHDDGAAATQEDNTRATADGGNNGSIDTRSTVRVNSERDIDDAAGCETSNFEFPVGPHEKTPTIDPGATKNISADVHNSNSLAHVQGKTNKRRRTHANSSSKANSSPNSDNSVASRTRGRRSSSGTPLAEMQLLERSRRQRSSIGSPLNPHCSQSKDFNHEDGLGSSYNNPVCVDDIPLPSTHVVGVTNKLSSHPQHVNDHAYSVSNQLQHDKTNSKQSTRLSHLLSVNDVNATESSKRNVHEVRRPAVIPSCDKAAHTASRHAVGDGILEEAYRDNTQSTLRYVDKSPVFRPQTQYRVSSNSSSQYMGSPCTPSEADHIVITTLPFTNEGPEKRHVDKKPKCKGVIEPIPIAVVSPSGELITNISQDHPDTNKHLQCFDKSFHSQCYDLKDDMYNATNDLNPKVDPHSSSAVHSGPHGCARLPKPSKYKNSPYVDPGRSKFFVSKLQIESYNAMIMIENNPTYRCKQCVDIDKVRTIWKSFVGSFGPGGVVDSYTMNAFCRYLYKQIENNGKQKKHFFFHTATEYFLRCYKDEDEEKKQYEAMKRSYGFATHVKPLNH